MEIDLIVAGVFYVLFPSQKLFFFPCLELMTTWYDCDLVEYTF